jgi:N-methylhydantoinase A/oxoprolinase/acetone carboxylase beta subunit
MDLRLGIDVGGTNTDAVIIDTQDRLLAKTKTATTPDVGSGIAAAIELVTDQLGPAGPGRITHVMLGTTHATNAVLQRRNLGRVATIRIAGPGSTAIPPLAGLPGDVRRAVSAGEVVVDGGMEFSGEQVVPLDRDAIARFVDALPADVTGIAMTSVFSPISPVHELEAEQIVRKIRGDVHISLGHEIGTLGLLERENACLLNAALIDVARGVTDGLRAALDHCAIDAAVYIAQNDGTLMGIDKAVRYPVFMIGSGPANSIRGAAFLSGQLNALVVDVGGTSSDIGLLVNGFPRESSAPSEIGGVRTNFRMPDLVSIAIGGGTVVTAGASEVTVGPRSVANELEYLALAFGGTVATLTDAAALAGRTSLGTEPIGAGFGAMLTQALRTADTLVAEAIDRIKSSRRALPLVAVGGASFLLPDDIPGISVVLRPQHHDVANAIGASISTVSGHVDRVYRLEPARRQSVLDAARQAAMEDAVRAGADPGRVEIVEIDEVPIAYLTEPAVRLRVRASGPLLRD